MNLVCIQANNSVNFIQQVFDAYASKKLFAIADCDSVEEFELSRGIVATEFIATSLEGEWLGLEQLPIDENIPAQVVFTSGTEGKPKAIVLSHAGLKNVVDRINMAMVVDSSIREYIGVPVYHSFGLGRCRAVAAVGGRAYIPQNGFDLKEIKTMLDEDRINALSAVPSLLRIVLDNTALFESVAHKVKWIEIGSQYMSAGEKQRLRDLFSEANIVQHYGLTEASRTSLLRIDQVPASRLESVGVLDSSMSASISEDGRLKIKGPHVALGILDQNDIVPLLDSDGYFETSDLADIQDGYLYFKGRADDVINCSGVKFDPANIEAELNRGYEFDEHVYIARIPDEYRGDGVLVNILQGSKRDVSSVTDEVDQLLAKNNIHARSAIKFQYVADFPKTNTNKIKRKELATLYLDSIESQPGTQDGNTVESLFCKIFNVKHIDEKSSFNALGGDSLTYVQASVGLERLLGFLPNSWENLSVGELSAKKYNKKKNVFFLNVETGIFLRCIAIIAVVSHHSGLGLVRGGAALLMFIAGYNYCRFQLPKILKCNSFSVLKSIFINVLLPYWIIVILFLVYKGNGVQIYELLFINNVTFTRPAIPFQVWFIQTLLQCILILSLPLLVPKIRNWVRLNTILYIFLWACSFFVFRLVDQSLGLGSSYNLGGGQVSWTAWLFGAGALMFILEERYHKVLLSIVVVISAALLNAPDYSRIILISSGLLILWMPQVILPRLLIGVIQVVSSASLFIYMLHGRAPIDSITAQWPIDLIRIIGGVLIGVVAYMLYSFGFTVLAKIRHWVFSR